MKEAPNIKTREKRDLKPGISPRLQLKEANKHRSGRQRFSYMPHYGAKERAKAAKRAAKEKTATKG